jgi:hypothetical protein
MTGMHSMNGDLLASVTRCSPMQINAIKSYKPFVELLSPLYGHLYSEDADSADDDTNSQPRKRCNPKSPSKSIDSTNHGRPR